MIRVKETLIRQASDVICWLDATGREGQSAPVLNNLLVELDQDLPVKGLSLLHKPGCSIIWRSQLSDNQQLQRSIDSGRATEEQKQRPLEVSYLLKGTVSDPSGTFNPRVFQKNCGNNSYPQIALYRSPDGTRLSQHKALQGLLRYQKQADEIMAKPASWALVSLQVNLSSTGDSFIFNAQADSQGYFRLPLTRLSLTMLSMGFTASLTVKADKTQSGSVFPDPDQMTAMQIALADSNIFAAGINVLAEQKQHRLILGFVPDETGVTTLELKSP